MKFVPFHIFNVSLDLSSMGLVNKLLLMTLPIAVSIFMQRNNMDYNVIFQLLTYTYRHGLV